MDIRQSASVGERHRLTLIDRRSALAGAALSLWPHHLGSAQETEELSFSATWLRGVARALAAAPYKPPQAPNGSQLKQLTYDQYRDIRFRADQALWRGEGLPHQAQMFPVGWLYDVPVELFTVTAGRAERLLAGPHQFSAGSVAGPNATVAMTGFSGFRLHSAINRPDYFDEYVVFQGASYLRAVGRNLGYGLSARGLAIDTAQPGGEEFPAFRAFWIQRPQRDNASITVHALLDSPSVAGAYRFVIEPGPATVMTIDATLFPRRRLSFVGLAPLTSMFLAGPAHRRLRDDFRPAVHDSDGLCIVGGDGERVWRPLTNPKLLQMSSFSTNDPAGFGLLQRARSFAAFEDLEARYERRPSCWVEPIGAWGPGHVDLVELPTDEEIHDNIVAAWRPKTPIDAGAEHSYSYRLNWAAEPSRLAPLLSVVQTRVGKWSSGEVQFVVDLNGDGLRQPDDLPQLAVHASAGTLSRLTLQRHEVNGGLRAAFLLTPGPARMSELRLVLTQADRPVSETWLYRWTRD